MKLYLFVACMVVSLLGCENNSQLKRLETANQFNQNEYDVWLSKIVHNRKVVEENLVWFRYVVINLAFYTLPGALTFTAAGQKRTKLAE